MTSVTEKVIRDQFSYLAVALTQPLPEIPDGKLVFVGCGTSYYLAQALACIACGAGRQAVAVPGSEWARRRGNYLAQTSGAVVIGLSRSGATTETVQALEASRKVGLTTVALTCEPDSPIMKAADTAIYLPTDPREGIVMTVSASLLLLAGLRLLGQSVTQADLDAGAAALAATGQAAALLKGRSHFVYLGAGALYGIANEAALKLQEMSLSYAQAFHPMEYRHGPISLIDEGSVVAILYSAETPREEAQLAAEVQAKGASVIGIGGPGDVQIALSVAGPALGLAALPALQILGEMVALQKNINTATPRHLTKVVMLGQG